MLPTRSLPLLPRLLPLALALVAFAPSAQALASERNCIGTAAQLVCGSHVDVTIDPDSGQFSLAFGVCGDDEAGWYADADVDTGGGSVWIPESGDMTNGPTHRESYGSHCGGQDTSPPDTGIHQRVYV